MDEEFDINEQAQLYLNFLRGAIELGLFDLLEPYTNLFFNQKLYTEVKCLTDFDEQVR